MPSRPMNPMQRSSSTTRLLLCERPGCRLAFMVFSDVWSTRADILAPRSATPAPILRPTEPRRNGMKKLIVALLVAFSANASAQTSKPADVDAIIKQLESSGALDAALDRAIQRLQQREADAQRNAETQRNSQMQDKAKTMRKVSTARDH